MRHIIVGCLAISLLAAPATFAANRRRAAPSVPKVSTPGPGSDCHTFGFVTPGTKASYLTTTSSGNVSFTITWLSDTATQTHTTQHVVTPQATSDVDTVLDGEVVGQLRGLKHFNVKTTTAVPILGPQTIEADVTFVPSLLGGPAEGWCTGKSWSIAPTTETIVTRTPLGQSTQIVTTIASEGKVLAVGESVTVPAGTFRTVKYQSAIVSGTNAQPAITWTSMDLNIVVKQDTLDASGNVTTSTELQSVQH